MDSMGDSKTSQIAGKILLQDLMATSSKINYEVGDDHIGLRTQVIIDEFASFATEDFVEFIAKARSAGIGVAMLINQEMI